MARAATSAATAVFVWCCSLPSAVHGLTTLHNASSAPTHSKSEHEDPRAQHLKLVKQGYDFIGYHGSTGYWGIKTKGIDPARFGTNSGLERGQGFYVSAGYSLANDWKGTGKVLRVYIKAGTIKNFGLVLDPENVLDFAWGMMSSQGDPNFDAKLVALGSEGPYGLEAVVPAKHVGKLRFEVAEASQAAERQVVTWPSWPLWAHLKVSKSQYTAMLSTLIDWHGDGVTLASDENALDDDEIAEVQSRRELAELKIRKLSGGLSARAAYYECQKMRNNIAYRMGKAAAAEGD